MKLLILGGTIFLGRHLVNSALMAGHHVTLFNRGIHGADLFPEVESIRGNRDGDLAGLLNETWDAVIDTCGYIPRIVKQSVDLLQKRVGHYTFISSISAYADPPFENMDESAPLALVPVTAGEEITGETYGPFKVLCEQVVQEAFAERALIIRPGLIVGPHDPTDRFTYWPTRIFRSGETAAPGNPFHPIQVIDVRDLAFWIIKMAEKKVGGVFNATGPENRLSMVEFLNLCRECIQSESKFTWLSEEFLLENQIEPYVDFPLWLPAESKAMQEISILRALNAGMELRPLSETILDTLQWDRSRLIAERRAGLTRLKEEELLRNWKVSNQMC